TDELSQRRSRQQAQIHSGKRSCRPKNPGGHAVGRDTAHGAVERLRHQMVKVHSESSPDRGLAVGPRIPGKADARPKIFVGTLVPRFSKRRCLVSQRIPDVGELAIGLGWDSRELVAKPQVQGQIGASLKVVLEIKSEQVLAPAPDVIARESVSIELCSLCS